MIAIKPVIGNQYWFINHKVLYPRLNDVFEGILLAINDNGTVACKRLADDVEFPNLSRLCIFDCNPMYSDTVKELTCVPIPEIPVVDTETKTEHNFSISLQEFIPRKIQELRINDRVYVRWNGEPGLPKWLHNTWVHVMDFKRTKVLVNPYDSKIQDNNIWINFDRIKKVQRPL